MTTNLPEVPAWLNLDALITADELAEIAAVRDELLALVPLAVKVSARMRAVYMMSNRWDVELDGSHELFNRLTGADAVDDLCWLLTRLLGHNAGWPADEHVDKIAAKWESTIPGLTEAVQEAAE